MYLNLNIKTKSPGGFLRAGLLKLQGPLLAHRRKPAPGLAQIEASPAEVRVATILDIREDSVAVRVLPRRIGDAAEMLSVRLEHLLNGLSPLPLRNIPVKSERGTYGFKVGLVAYRYPLETAGHNAFYHRSAVLPVAGVAVAAYHL